MIHSAPEPGYGWRQTGTVRAAMLTRHAVSVMNCRAVQINSAIAPRRAKTSAGALAVLYAFSLPPWSPLARARRASGSGLQVGRSTRGLETTPLEIGAQNFILASTTEVIAPTPSVTIICGRYCADSPPACVLKARVIATYSPGAVASIQGQENIQ
jgi:hypothetical protein